MSLPNHIAIIMDGNGRWGKKKFNNRSLGHKFGIKNIKNIINFCIKKNIPNLTLFAFSQDNFKRSKHEVSYLFSLFKDYFFKNEKFFDDNGISLLIGGEKKKLPNYIKKLIQKINTKKINKKKLNLNIAFNYSSKNEIANTFNYLKKKKKIFNKKNVDNFLYFKRSGDPEVLIRTGGMCRLSDFMLWQLSYSEIFFVKKLWPVFKGSDLFKILNKFKNIKRNFGSNE
jgi:undecaprenyl diphosphate synthase